VSGAWDVIDKSSKKRCRIIFKPELTIGGSEIAVAKGCERRFRSWARSPPGLSMRRVDHRLGRCDAEATHQLQHARRRNAAEPETDGICTILKR
jgi:hypothetical protein